MIRNLTRLSEVEQAFHRKSLKRVCEANERSFADAYGMQTVMVPDRRAPDNFFFYKDNGSNVLAVAHLDTVAYEDDRQCRFVVTEGAGTVVFSRALDDRLGAYIILELLPKLGLEYDILLTVGEESAQSTAEFFDPPEGKHYDYMVEFDRGGTDVVMYQYDDADVRARVKACGARVGDGSFSDISYLGHLGIKGFNWGVGYQDYHGPRAHAFLDDTFAMVARYLRFAEQNEGVYMPHHGREEDTRYSSWSQRNWWDEDDNYRDEYAEHLSNIDRGEDDDESVAWRDRLSNINRVEDYDEDSDYIEHPSLAEIDAALA